MKKIALLAATALVLSACGGQFPNPFEGLAKKPQAPAETPSEGPLDAIGVADGPADAAVDAPAEVPVEAPAAKPAEVGGAGQSAEALDTTTAAQKAEATKAPAGAATLGSTVASLGDPTQQGFWLRTPLVTQEAEGAVETEGGAVVQVKLIPIDGESTAGSRISLAAMRALGLGLTDLATLKVSRS